MSITLTRLKVFLTGNHNPKMPLNNMVDSKILNKPPWITCENVKIHGFRKRNPNLFSLFRKIK